MKTFRRSHLFGLALWLCSSICAGAQTPKNDGFGAIVFPLVMEDPGRGYGQPVVEVTLNHKAQGKFMLDTGSANCLISDAFARKLGLTSLPLKDTQGSIVEQDHKPVQYVHVDAMTLTDMRDHTSVDTAFTDFIVLPAKKIRNGNPDKIDGIIGMQFLSKVTLMLDPKYKTITLFWPRELNNKEFTDLQMDGATTLALADRGDGVLTANLQLNSKLDITMTVDTGAGGTIIPMTTVDKLGLKPLSGHRPAITMSGNATVYELMMERMSLGSTSLAWTRIYCTDGMKGLDQTLGMDLLSRFRLLLDGPNKKLYLKSYTTEIAAPDKK